MKHLPMKHGPIALALLLALSQAGAQHTHSNSHAWHAAPMSMQQMNEADLKALRPLTGRKFDVAFAQRMIGHHRMAVDMAQYAYKNATDKRVRQNAQAVMNVQGREIDQMVRWLNAWKAPVPAQEQASFTGIKGSPERWFLTEMIPHHQGAIDMAKLAQTRSKDRNVLNMAAAILKTQQAEINQYQTWLKTVK